MPTISRFYGIRVFMNTDEHPPPHFHAQYGDWEAAVSIETGQIVVGDLPSRAMRLVHEWRTLHRAELEDNWHRVETEKPLSRIAPL